MYLYHLAELATLHCRDDGTVQASVAVLILGEQAVRGEDISARGRSAELLVRQYRRVYRRGPSAG